MANIKSAQKQARQALVRKKINLARRTSVKTAIRKVLVALEQKEDVTRVRELMQDAEAKIARARGKGVLHANTAARKISRLAKKVASAQR